MVIVRGLKKLMIKFLGSKKGTSITEVCIASAISLSTLGAGAMAYDDILAEAKFKLDGVTAQKMSDILNSSLEIDGLVYRNNLQNPEAVTMITEALKDEIETYYDEQVPLPFREGATFWAFYKPNGTFKVKAFAPGETYDSTEIPTGSVAFPVN